MKMRFILWECHTFSVQNGKQCLIMACLGCHDDQSCEVEFEGGVIESIIEDNGTNIVIPEDKRKMKMRKFLTWLIKDDSKHQLVVVQRKNQSCVLTSTTLIHRTYIGSYNLTKQIFQFACILMQNTHNYFMYSSKGFELKT